MTGVRKQIKNVDFKTFLKIRFEKMENLGNTRARVIFDETYSKFVFLKMIPLREKDCILPFRLIFSRAIVFYGIFSENGTHH